MNQRQKIIELLKTGYVGNGEQICIKLSIKKLRPYSLFRDLEREEIIYWEPNGGKWIINKDDCNRCRGSFFIADMIEEWTPQTYNEPSAPDGYICNNCAKVEADYFKEQEQKYEETKED